MNACICATNQLIPFLTVSLVLYKYHITPITAITAPTINSNGHNNEFSATASPVVGAMAALLAAAAPPSATASAPVAIPNAVLIPILNDSAVRTALIIAGNLVKFDANCAIPLTPTAKLPACPINPINEPSGDNTPLADKVTSSHAAPIWSSMVLCSASSSANVCSWPSYSPVNCVALLILPDCNPRASSNALVSPLDSFNASFKPVNAARPPPNFCVAPAIITEAWSTFKPNSLN